MIMDILSKKIVKTRKPHRCFACWEMFDSGTEMEAGTYKDDGDIYTLYCCEICQNLLSEFPGSFIDDDDRFQEGCVAEIMAEYKCDSPEALYYLFAMSTKTLKKGEWPIPLLLKGSSLHAQRTRFPKLK